MSLLEHLTPETTFDEFAKIIVTLNTEKNLPDRTLTLALVALAAFGIYNFSTDAIEQVLQLDQNQVDIFLRIALAWQVLEYPDPAKPNLVRINSAIFPILNSLLDSLD